MSVSHLKEGDSAPNFEGVDQNGEAISLSDYKGKKLIVFFYPADNTPGCTLEVCSLRDGYAELQGLGYELIGVSPDSERKHRNFIKKHNLPFPLLADTEKEVLKAFGVWDWKKFMGRKYIGVHRTTFLINEKGKIEKIYDKVKTMNHSDQILADIG
ncbi:MAG: peroxiredoxin [Saprospiraceae bacterium]|nr:MAG: peroxiredoxin [Saprospiraceae bacterium]